MNYPFTEEQLETAHDEWGCNCGPSALAFALQVPIAAVRHAIPGFAQKGYTSPTMMQAGLAFFKRAYRIIRPPNFIKGQYFSLDGFFHRQPALIRIQWTGPWTALGANPRWAYGQTHWICTWEEGSADGGGVNLVFDCNGGAMTFTRWETEIAPMIIKHTPRADGEWFPTHIWRIEPVKSEGEGILEIGDAQIACAVLDDGRRVLSRIGFLRAIGRKGKAKGGRMYDEEFKTPVFW